VIRKVSAQQGIRIEDDHITSVIRGKETILPESVIQMIWDSAKRHADTILDKLRELQVDLRSTPANGLTAGKILHPKI